MTPNTTKTFLRTVSCVLFGVLMVYTGLLNREVGEMPWYIFYFPLAIAFLISWLCFGEITSKSHRGIRLGFILFGSLFGIIFPIAALHDAVKITGNWGHFSQYSGKPRYGTERVFLDTGEVIKQDCYQLGGRVTARHHFSIDIEGITVEMQNGATVDFFAGDFVCVVTDSVLQNESLRHSEDVKDILIKELIYDLKEYIQRTRLEDNALLIIHRESVTMLGAKFNIGFHQILCQLTFPSLRGQRVIHLLWDECGIEEMELRDSSRGDSLMHIDELGAHYMDKDGKYHTIELGE